MKTCIALLVALLMTTYVQAQKHPLSVGVYGLYSYSSTPLGIKNKFDSDNGRLGFIKGLKLSTLHRGFEIGIGVEQSKIVYEYSAAHMLKILQGRLLGAGCRTDAVFVSPYLFANHSILRIGNNYFYSGARLGYMAFLTSESTIGGAYDFYDEDVLLLKVPTTFHKNIITAGVYTGYNIVALPRLCVQVEVGLNYVPLKLSYLDVESNGNNVTINTMNTSFLQVPFTIGLVYHFGKHHGTNEQVKILPVEEAKK